MGKVVSDMSMSLDGFITGPNDSVEQPLGEGGERLPILLGGSRRLFDHVDTDDVALERTRVIESPGVTHLRFRVVK